MASRATRSRRIAAADALHSAAIHLLRGVRKEDAQSGVGPARLSALSVLVFAGPMRLTELASLEQVKPPTMTRIVKGLEVAGFVKRGPDKTDARATRLEATPRGVRLLYEGRRRRVMHLAHALATLEPNDIEVLARTAELVEQILPRL